MAMMASPNPEASTTDGKSRDLPAQKEEKPEINGHAPTPEPKIETESPIVNGDGKDKDQPTNGETDDVKMGDSDDTKPQESSPAKDAPTSTSEDVEPAELNGDGKKFVSAPSEDVDMDMPDATETNESAKPTEHKPSESDSDPKPNAEPLKDSEMADDAHEDPVLGETNGLPELPAPSDPLPSSGGDLQPASPSQLALESESTAKPSIEVAMEDAPPAEAAPSAKVSREREDDALEEPAPKRARTTEPKEDVPMVAAAAVAEAPAQEEESALSRLNKWHNSEVNSQEITPFQRREIRKVLGRVKKTKHGAHFRDSVQKLWPGLWDSYLAKIEKPTDLSEIDRTMRDPNGAYRTINDFRKDLLLMYENTLAFNGPQHDVTNAAQGCIRAIWDDVLTIPQEEPVRPKPVPKQKPPRESRAAAHPEPVVKKPSAPPGPIPTREVAPVKPPPAQDKASDLRRASTATDGDRPKRTVRAPKPKDIDYTTKPTRKKLKPELQFCEEVINDLMHPKNKHLNAWFMDAVDAEGLNIPQYYSIIKKPMDLGKVARLLSAGDISSLKDFDRGVRLIFSNCYTFNGTPDQGNAVSLMAKQLEDYYTRLMKGKDSWLAKHAKANAPPVASNASDEEEEEEAEEEEDSSQATALLNKQIQDMEARLREESMKLTDLYAAESPSQTLIDVQQSIVKVVQDRLLKVKGTLGELRSRQEKPAKKASKPSKSKASGGTARKPSGAAAHPKKSGGTKKAAPKRALTAADKDAIANAINDLESVSLDRAIEIIKRDTGQNENNQGELELDIDQLSNEALLKLWELCKKVLPGFGKDSAPAVVSSPEMSRPAPAKAPKTAAKPKKNKPMSAREQEERIAQLKGLRELYRPGQDTEDMSNVIQAPTPTAESSDDSDSEEE